MMAALLQKELGDEFEVKSAGMWRKVLGHPANGCAVLCMRERGIDISGHNGRWIGHLDLTQFSHIVCVDKEMAERIHQFLEGPAEVLVVNGDNGGVPDPYDKGFSAYRECADLLEMTLPEVAKQILG